MQETFIPPIFSKELKTKGKTYFFDIKQAKTGSKYLAITDSSMNKDGKKFRSTVTVFSNNLKEFATTLEEVLGKF
jgi:hypothetical protein